MTALFELKDFSVAYGAVALTGPAEALLSDRRIIDTYLGLGNKKAAVAVH